MSFTLGISLLIYCNYGTTLIFRYKKFEEHTADILCQKFTKLQKKEEEEALTTNPCVLASASNWSF